MVKMSHLGAAMYLYDRVQLVPENQLGETPAPTPPLRMHPRCARRIFKVPSTYEDFEEAAKRWISNCVTSRTRGAHREQQLVTGNRSLADIWNKILRYRVGQEVVILAEYLWGPNRVESITFSTS